MIQESEEDCYEPWARQSANDISLLTKEQFDNEIQKGFSDFENGRTFTAEQVQAQLLKHENDN